MIMLGHDKGIVAYLAIAKNASALQAIERNSNIKAVIVKRFSLVVSFTPVELIINGLLYYKS